MASTDQQNFMSSSQQQSVDTFAPVAVYRFKHYKANSLFDQVLHMLIRPPRFVYNQKLLIPTKKYKQKFQYEIHQIPFPISIYWAENPKYIILYLHGNSSSRFEGYLHLKQLPEGACLACFDFNGCGLRKEGNYITLGKQESIQVDQAIEFLESYGLPVVGWGRSMGSVSLLISKRCDIMIADSPFSSLYDLCKQTSLNFLPSCLCCLVHCIFPCLFCCVRSGVQKRSGMDPNQLQVIKAVQNQSTHKHILIMAGQQDSMIHFSHARRLYDAFKGKNKRIIIFDGTHNSNRPSDVTKECFTFIENAVENLKFLNKENNNKIGNLNKLNNNAKRVLKVQRSSSKISCVKIKEQEIFRLLQSQTTKDNLIPKQRSQAQHRSIKVSPIKKPTSSRITTSPQFQQCEKIYIHIQNSIQKKKSIQQEVRQAIGKFQQDLHKRQQNLSNKLKFKQISKSNTNNNFSQNNSINLTKIQMQKSNKKSRQKTQQRGQQKQQISLNQFEQEYLNKENNKFKHQNKNNHIIQNLKLNLKNIKPKKQDNQYKQFKSIQGDQLLMSSQSYLNVKPQQTINQEKLGQLQKKQQNNFNIIIQDDKMDRNSRLLNMKYHDPYQIMNGPSPKNQKQKEKNLQTERQISKTRHLSNVKQSDIKLLNDSKSSTREIEIKSIQKKKRDSQAYDHIQIILSNQNNGIFESIQSNLVQGSQTSQIRRDQMFSKMKQPIRIKQMNNRNSKKKLQNSSQIMNQFQLINQEQPLNIQNIKEINNKQKQKQIVTIQQIN